MGLNRCIKDDKNNGINRMSRDLWQGIHDGTIFFNSLCSNEPILKSFIPFCLLLSVISI